MQAIQAFLDTMTLWGVPIIAFVILFTEGCKKLGVPGGWAPVVALIWGILLCLLAGALSHPTTWDEWSRYVVAGIATGFIAMGGYSGVKAFTGHVIKGAPENTDAPKEDNEPTI